MENLKELLAPKTFNRISYVAVFGWFIYGVILLGIFAEMENSDSFRCEAKLEKIDLVRAKCSGQYKKQYNKSGIPVYGFVIADFSLIGIVCLIYSQVVKSRVHHLLVAGSSQRADPERQNNDGNRPKRRKLFVAYLCQLAIRFAIGILFIVLQTQVLYPDNFPSDFHCQIAGGSHATNASSTGNIQNSTMYECHNQQATKKNFWMNAVIVANGVLALIILIEIICILALRAKKGKTFLKDLEFLKYYLPPKEPQELVRSPQELQELIRSLQEPHELVRPPRELQELVRPPQEPQELVHPPQEPQELVRPSQEPQELVRLPQEPQELVRPPQEPPQGLLRIEPEGEQLQQLSVIDKFIKSQKERIIEITEKDPGLEALFQENPGEGKRNKDLKLDQIYVNLSLILDRARYDFTGTRQEQLKVFPMPKGNFQQISREDIVDAENKKILIVGRPGIGKTLFLTNLIRDWALGKAFIAEFHSYVAFFLKFRKFNSVGELSLRDLLSWSEYSHTEILNDEVWSYVLTNPVKVLMLFDGLDEFSDISSIATANEYRDSAEQKMPLSALYNKITEGNLLPGSTVLTTIRPNVVSSVKTLHFDRTVEILGFASEQVEEYVAKFTKDAGEDVADAGKKIWEHIKTNMNIFSLCYIPANCFIICSCLMQILKLDSAKGSTGVLPTKLTDIYQTAMKLFFARHNERRTPVDIESRDLPPEMENKIKPLARIAFDGLTQRKLIFGTDEVGKDLVSSALFHRLPDHRPSFFTREAQYCFIHLTMQEFLAAKHIVDTMEGKKLRRFVADHINEGEWQLVLQFVAGLLGEQSIDIFTDLLPETTEEKDESLLMIDLSLEGRKLTCWPTDSEQHLAVTVMKCIVEANESGSVVQSKLEEIGFNAVDFSRCGLAPADCTAVVHLLKSCTKISLIRLSANNIGSLGCVEIVKLFDISNSTLTGLNLARNNITYEGVKLLSDALVNNNKLRRLNLANNNITDKGVKLLSDALVNNNKLHSLNLTSNNITDKGVKLLSDALVNNNKLRRLNLTSNNITDEGVKLLSAALVNNNELHSLNLEWNHKITTAAINQIEWANPNCKVSI